jgi:hypothetical protein
MVLHLLKGENMDVVKTQCIFCGIEVMATKDDFTPKCEVCQGRWALSQAVTAIMNGEIPDDEEEE